MPEQPPQKTKAKKKKQNMRFAKKNSVDPRFIGKSQPAEKNRSGRARGRQKGAFVYQGAGKKHSKDATLSERKCEKHTIAVQWCLAKNDHKQDRCQDLVDVWKACKQKWDEKEKAGR